MPVTPDSSSQALDKLKKVQNHVSNLRGPTPSPSHMQCTYARSSLPGHARPTPCRILATAPATRHTFPHDTLGAPIQKT